MPTEASWHDIGHLPSYLAAHLRPPDLAPSLLAGNARIAERARLDRVVVGEGGAVDGVGDVIDVVVWPRARAEAPLRRALVVDGDQVIRL